MSPSLEGQATSTTKATTGRRKASAPWARVVKGQDVLLEKGHERFEGIVDDFTDDGDIVWIKSSTGERRLFHVSDGYGLSLHPT